MASKERRHMGIRVARSPKGAWEAQLSIWRLWDYTAPAGQNLKENNMADLELSKTCEECNQPCKPIPVSSNPVASEFFCIKCHKSYPMAVDAAKYILAHEARNRG